MDYTDKTITLESGKSFIVIEQVNFENETYLYTAQRELEEELGVINPYDLEPIVTYKFIPTTQMNEIVTLYIFDVTNKEITVPKTDGSYYELISENK